MEHKEQEKKKSVINFRKLLIGAAVVSSAAMGAITGLQAAKNDGTLASVTVNVDNHQIPTEAKDCATIAIKTMQVVSNRTLVARSFDKQSKEDKKVIQDLIRPLAEEQSKGAIDLYNPSKKDVETILMSCINNDGYLANVHKAAEYVISTIEKNRTIEYQSSTADDEAKISIKINKPTQQDGATISYKLKT